MYSNNYILELEEEKDITSMEYCCEYLKDEYMADSCYALVKYGKKEHLEDLKNGRIFFNAIKKYRNDGTEYRGDSMEGRIPIDPSTIAIYDKDGKNIFDYLPRPDTVTQTLYNDENFLMFCASAITKEIMEEKEKNHWRLSEEYKKEMKQFGDYALIFESGEFLEKIIMEKKIHIPRFGYDAGIVKYHDLSDFSNMSVYRTMGNITDRYFVKGSKYKLQNEWRMVIGGEYEPLELNCFDGYFINSTPFQYAALMRTDEFMEKLELVEREEQNL